MNIPSSLPPFPPVMAMAQTHERDLSVSAPAHSEGNDTQSPAHLRPVVVRRETDQILSYYQSADAGVSEPGPRYRYPTPDPDGRHRRGSTSSSSTYSNDSISDYGSPQVECARRERIGYRDSSTIMNSNRYEVHGAGGVPGMSSDSVNVHDGLALGSPGELALPGAGMLTLTIGDQTDMDTEVDRDGRDGNRRAHIRGRSLNMRTDDGPGYGSRFIIEPGPFANVSGPRASARLRDDEARPQSNITVLPASCMQSTSYTNTLVEEPLSRPLSGDVCDGEEIETTDENPGMMRRKTSTRGASDKRRVAIVQMDSAEGEGEGRRERDGESESAGGMVSDGSGRGQHSETNSAQLDAQIRQQQAQTGAHNRQFVVSPSYNSSTASALLARRGIIGTFALVAAPDASPSAYPNLGCFISPPLSAPASAHATPPPLLRHESAESSASVYSNTSTSSCSSARRQHQRSQSEAVLTTAAPHGSINRSIPKPVPDANLDETANKGDKRRPGHRLRNSSRDIGIVGTSSLSPQTSTATMTNAQSSPIEIKVHTTSDTDPSQNAQLSPIFQSPPSRSQTSLSSSDGESLSEASESHPQPSAASKEPKRRSQQRTPNISAASNGRTAETHSANSAAPRSPTNAAGSDTKQTWHSPPLSLSTTGSTSYYTSNSIASPSYSYYSMATTVSSSSSVSSPAPTVFTIPPPAPSPYLYYQPGLHATAGPLPSPPRQIIPPKRNSPPPPRPPRLHAPSSGASPLAKRRSDTSITSKQEHAARPEILSPSMTPSTTSSTLVNSHSEDSAKSKGHAREGGFSSDSPVSSDATLSRLSVKQNQGEEHKLTRKNTMEDLVRDVTVAIDEAAGITEKVEDAAARSATEGAPSLQRVGSVRDEQRIKERGTALDLRREGSRSTFQSAEPQRPASPSSTYSDDDDDDNIGDITVTKAMPDPRADSQESVSKPHKMLDIALKRFSALPRPPSISRLSFRSSVSHERRSQEHSENVHKSEAGHERQGTTPRTRKVYASKTRSAWPDAMQFGDVLAKRSPLERSLAYARKINELANYDPGLGDWVATTKHNLTVPRKGSKRKSLSPGAPRAPSEQPTPFQPRHSSGGSIGSEMTFPKRVDAYVATDLLPQRSEDESLPRGPPPLPYPTLAQGASSQQPSSRLGGSNSTRNNASSLGGSKSTGGGFFASIGRKASVKKDRPAFQGAATAAVVQPNKLLSKRQKDALAPAPRPVQITVAPPLRGGPRAPPGRVQRAQSAIAPKVPNVAESEPETDLRRKSTKIKRSSSVVPPKAETGSGSVTDVESSVDIESKVGKLADLLPHADKKTLAGYLRRAGGMDMVAIGRYLDDEKNGVLIRG